MLRTKIINNRVWLFINGGCEVHIFRYSWEAANYTLLRFGCLPIPM
jgi:hypothetical protein